MRENLSYWFLTRSYQNQPAQLQKQARIVKFRMTLSNKRSFENPKHMIKLMGKKIFSIFNFTLKNFGLNFILFV